MWLLSPLPVLGGGLGWGFFSRSLEERPHPCPPPAYREREVTPRELTCERLRPHCALDRDAAPGYE